MLYAVCCCGLGRTSQGATCTCLLYCVWCISQCSRHLDCFPRVDTCLLVVFGFGAGPSSGAGSMLRAVSTCTDLSCQLAMHALSLCVCMCHLQQCTSIRSFCLLFISPWPCLLCLHCSCLQCLGSAHTTYTHTLMIIMTRWVLSCLYHHLMCRPTPSVLRDLRNSGPLCWWWWHECCVAQNCVARSIGPLCMLESSSACASGCGCRQSADAAKQRTTSAPALFDSIGCLPDWLDACASRLLCRQLCKPVFLLLQAAG